MKSFSVPIIFTNAVSLEVANLNKSKDAEVVEGDLSGRL